MYAPSFCASSFNFLLHSSLSIDSMLLIHFSLIIVVNSCVHDFWGLPSSFFPVDPFHVINFHLPHSSWYSLHPRISRSSFSFYSRWTRFKNVWGNLSSLMFLHVAIPVQLVLFYVIWNRIFNTFKYHVFAPMGRFQLESIYLYFPPSSQLLHLCFCPVGLSLL